MAKIFNLPKEFQEKLPRFHYGDGTLQEYRERENAFIAELKAMLEKRRPGKNVGEIITYPVADGKAIYMIASMKPLELVHVPFMDGYHFNYAHRWTVADVNDIVKGEKALKELFNKPVK